MAALGCRRREAWLPATHQGGNPRDESGPAQRGKHFSKRLLSHIFKAGVASGERSRTELHVDGSLPAPDAGWDS